MGLSDYRFALEFRDELQRLVREEVERQRPRYQMGTVVSIDRDLRRCVVSFPADTTNSTVSMGSIQPSSVGQVVRVEGLAGDRYISDVMGPAYYADATENWILNPDGSATIGGLNVFSNGTTDLDAATITMGVTSAFFQRTLAQKSKASSGTNTYEVRRYLYNGTTTMGLAEVLLENGTEVSRVMLYPDGTGFEVRDTVNSFSSFYRANGYISSYMRGMEFKYSDTSGLSLASPTAVATGTRGGAGTFVAPPSGSVKVGFGAAIQARTTGVYSVVGFEIRTGDTVGSGTVVRGYNFNDSAINYAATLANVWQETIVTGLTAGSTYNIQNMAASADTTAGATLYRARVIVTPQP